MTNAPDTTAVTTRPDVLFSPEIFGIQSFGGASRCMVELMTAMGTIGVDWRLWAGKHANQYIDAAKEDPAFAARTVDERQVKRPGRVGGMIANERPFARFAASTQPKVVHRSFYPIVDMVSSKIPSVLTLHDMWNERVVEESGWRARIAEEGTLLDSLRSDFKRRALRRADRIVCISEFTRQELAELWPELAERSVVIHHGVRRLSDTSTAPALDRPYFLFVGTRRGKKNFKLVLKALAMSVRLSPFDMVCVGDGPFTNDETSFAESIGVRGRIHHLRSNDAELAGLYEQACALLYPSRYEGFGMPLLEAMIHDCPVIAAPLAPLPEVAGDAALYADAFDAEAWMAQMELLAGSSEERDRLVDLGRKRAAKFTWTDGARAHASLYSEMAG